MELSLEALQRIYSGRALGMAVADVDGDGFPEVLNAYSFEIAAINPLAPPSFLRRHGSGRGHRRL